jgi:simple sugar transport system substrate-binding protein/rhamnose transport system substrate-binding protein
MYQESRKTQGGCLIMSGKVKITALMIIMSILFALFVGCSGQSFAMGNPAGAKKWKILVMPKFVGNPFDNRVKAGAEQAAADLGIDLTFTGPTEIDPTVQVNMVQDIITAGVDAICIAPNDPAALTPVLKKAKEQGIKVLDYDTAADPSVVDFSVRQVDDKAYGEHFIDLLVDAMGDSGEYAVQTGGIAAANLNTWIDYAVKYQQAKYPNLKMVQEVACEDKQQVAYTQCLDLIKAYPNLKGIIAFSTPTPLGSAQAIQEKGLQGKIALIGCGMPTDSLPYLEDGSMTIATLWDPAKLGYFAVWCATQLLEGKPIEDGTQIDFLGAKISVSGTTGIMGPPQDFTKDNAGDYDF